MANSEVKLAIAMNKLADRIEKFQDPVLWQKVLSDAVRVMPMFQQTEIQLLPQQIEGGSVRLSDDERTKLVELVNQAIQPQLFEFCTFVKQSLQDMPLHRLKRIADKIAAGESPKLEKRQGCVFIKVGDDEAYLGL